MSLKYKICFGIIGSICVISNYTYAQNQAIADSLVKIYTENSRFGKDKLGLLDSLAFNELKNPELSLKYADELIALSKSENNNKYLYKGYLKKGDSYKQIGQLDMALEFYFKSLEVSLVTKDLPDQGTANMYIADVYSMMGNSTNAQKYYKIAIEILRKTVDKKALGTALLNAGDEFFNANEYDLALQYFDESGKIFENSNNLIGRAYNYGNVGMVYAKQGKHEQAKRNINDAIKILQELGDYYPIAVYLTYMSDIYSAQGNYVMAFEYANQSLELAMQYELKEQISQANLKLSQLNDSIGNTQSAFNFYKNYVVFRDSVKNIETVQKMADLRTNHEVSQKQVEVDLLNQQKKNQRIIVYATGIALFLTALLVLGLFKRNKFVRATNKIIAAEKERSDNLLLNILPEETAQELKDKGRVAAQRFESVTVLFTDFKGFTHYAEHLSPEALVTTVDFYFSKFDEIMDRYGLEKIKTVGDAYMCAGGLPFQTEDHAIKMVQAAQDIIAFVHEAKTNSENEAAQFDIRVGINTGPLVAGVVGSKKFAYDIWGDTVNIASRMESASQAGKINVSENTYVLIKEKFNCIFRGELEVKNRGFLKMYFVENIKQRSYA